MLGAEMMVTEVLAEIEHDRTFYNRSARFVTIDGGEPLTQCEFVFELHRRCKERFLHTAIETPCAVRWKQLEEASAFGLNLLRHQAPEPRAAQRAHRD
jgi:pyruvate formate lyase activating enzyme